MKLWLLSKFTGAFGVPITAGLSALAALMVTKLYEAAATMPIVADVGREVARQLPPEQAQIFSPGALGAVVGAAVFAYIQQQLNVSLRAGSRAVQGAINAGLPVTEHILEDGLPMAETQAAARTLAARAAASSDPQ